MKSEDFGKNYSLQVCNNKSIQEFPYLIRPPKGHIWFISFEFKSGLKTKQVSSFITSTLIRVPSIFVRSLSTVHSSTMIQVFSIVFK